MITATALKILHNRRLLPLLTVFLMLSQAISAGNTEWNANNIVLPHVSDPMRYVSNPDNVVTKETEKVVNNIMRHMDTELGIESAVIIVHHVQNQDVYGMAQTLFNKYGIGKNDRGLVIILAFDDRVIRTHTGKSLEADLPDITCSRLQNKYAIPALKAFNPDKAIVRLASAIFYHLKGLPIPNLENDTLVSENYLNIQNGLLTASEQTDSQSTEDISVDHSAESSSRGLIILFSLLSGLSYLIGIMIGKRKGDDVKSFVSKYHIPIIIGGFIFFLGSAYILITSANAIICSSIFVVIIFVIGLISEGKSTDKHGDDGDHSDRGGYGGGRSGGGGASSRW